MAIGFACVMAGLSVSYYADLPPGGTIVLFAAGSFVAASGVAALRGL
jgi:ABC-type Mn2+/Zn2+ transport system permease subunit